MFNKHLFVVIEGIDGSGKTTIGKKLSKRLGSAFFQTPSGFWRRHRRIFENSHPVVRFSLYLLATFHSSLAICKILKEKPLVCDRYIYSTWAHHIVYGCRFLKHFPLNSLPIKAPDRVFYLYVSRDEREKRISGRAGNTLKDKDSETLEEVNKVFMQFKEMTLIDSTNLTKDEVANTILKSIRDACMSPAVRTGTR